MKMTGMLQVALCVGLNAVGMAQESARAAKSGHPFVVSLPTLECDSRAVREAFRIALGDLVGNIQPYKREGDHEPAPVLLAGLRYSTPWTRDSAINAWNGFSFIAPEVARNNFLAVLKVESGKTVVGGEYWDAVVWIIGAWHHYLYTGDRNFLHMARQVGAETLRLREQAEYDRDDGLFRGPGWSDGVAAYPDKYASAGRSAILAWIEHNPLLRATTGVGFPMKALSTNCLYVGAYAAQANIERELGFSDGAEWEMKASRLRDAINRRLWNEETGNYRFYVDPDGACELQEGLGAAYAILLGVADRRKRESIFSRQHVTPAGIPCGWPNLPRYASADGQNFGRHIGTVWPQVQGFWAEAAARFGRVDLMQHEFFALAQHAMRDLHFAELYHPTSGMPYGGLQEGPTGKGIMLWESMPRQSWAASAFLRMVFFGLVGMRCDESGVLFQPCVPEGLGRVVLRGLHYRQMWLEVAITGHGTRIRRIMVDGEQSTLGRIASGREGGVRVSIELDD
jgi:glycogen debranching enzyme